MSVSGDRRLATVGGWLASMVAIAAPVAIVLADHTAGTDTFTYGWSPFADGLKFERINAFDYGYVAALVVTVYWAVLLIFAKRPETSASKSLLVGALSFFVMAAVNFIYPWLPATQACDPVESAGRLSVQVCHATQTGLIWLSAIASALLIASLFLCLRSRQTDAGEL